MKPQIDAVRLVRDVRWLKAYSVASSLALIVLLVSAQVPAGPQRVAVLDVERLNVLNAARLEFLDAQGNVAAAFPG